jgi:hypothetical protein
MIGSGKKKGSPEFPSLAHPISGISGFVPFRSESIGGRLRINIIKEGRGTLSDSTVPQI